MARPLTISQITDLAIGATSENILNGIADAQLDEDSLVIVYMNRESVDVTAQITVGSVQVMPFGTSAINATAGSSPVVPDNRVCITAGRKGETLAINGANVNAAAQELRATVFIIPLVDIRNYPTILSNA